MKQILWLLLLCPAVGAADCPSRQAKDETTLVKIEKSWARALDQHDTNALGCILAAEFEDVGPDGKLTDRNSALAKVGTSQAVHHELSDLHAYVHGDFAYTRGLADTIDAQNNRTRVRFTDIYVYRDGRWQCLAGHESVVAALPHR